jgi:predicted Rossmann fold flavoprotein
MKKVIIIGGGAAGLFAAVVSARNGNEVTICERNPEPARKLNITGKGRCNLTNNCTRDEFFENITHNAKFLYSAYSKFDCFGTMDFFETLGVKLKTERGNRVFPESDRAKDISEALITECQRLGVNIRRFDVTKILTDEKTAVGVTDGVDKIFGDKIIIATGGKSYPKTGSDGTGFNLINDLGIGVTKLSPSLVPIICSEKYCREMMGLSLKNVRLDVTENSKKIFSEQGEMLFTDFGISGPLVLSASAHIVNFSGLKIHIDLKPALDEKTLNNRILRDFGDNPNRIFQNALDKLLPASMRPVMVKLSDISPEKQVNSITKEERKNLVTLFKNFPLTPIHFRTID